MIRTPKNLLLTALLAACGTVAFAQTPPPGREHHRMDRAQMQQRMAEFRSRHMAQLKDSLKLKPEQESAWNTFTEAMKPPAPPEGGKPMSREEFKKLTAPERIDLMEKRQAGRAARMKQMGEAVKTFYAQLTPEQQKTFDEHARHMGPRKGGQGFKKP
jgi:Spy/CpxP family protein refolding chaperone